MNVNRTLLIFALTGCIGTVVFASLWMRQRQARQPGEANAIPGASAVPRQNDLRRQLQAALKEAREAKDAAAIWRVRAESAEHNGQPSQSDPVISVNQDDQSRETLKSFLLHLITNPNDVNVGSLSQLGIAPDSSDFLAMAAALPKDNKRFGAISRLLDLWIKTDVDGALAWLKTLEDDKHYQSIVFGFAGKFFHQDSIRGEQWLETQLTGRLGDGLIRTFIVAIADDPLRAASWYARIKDPRVQRSVAGKIARHWWQKDAQAAAEWVAKIPDASTREAAVREVAIRGAAMDIEATLAWCDAMMDDKTFENTFPSIVSQLARTDLDSAADLVNDLPSGTVRDRSIQQAVSAIVRTDPGMAAAWAMTIADSRQRLGSLRQVAYQWGRSDADAAEKWLNEATLDAPDKKALTDIITRMKANSTGNRRR